MRATKAIFPVFAAGDRLRVAVTGALVEGIEAELAALAAKLAKAKAVELDCAKVTVLNSTGIRHWASFLDALAAVVPFEITGCVPAYLDYCTLLPHKLHAHRIRSALVTLVCTECGERTEKTLTRAALDRCDWDPREICPACQGGQAPEPALAPLKG